MRQPVHRPMRSCGLVVIFLLEACVRSSVSPDSGSCDSNCIPPKCTWIAASMRCVQSCRSDAECGEREVCLCDGPDCFFSEVTDEGPFGVTRNTCIFFGGPSRAERIDAGMKKRALRNGDASRDGS
jgi:hypothetical protein